MTIENSFGKIILKYRSEKKISQEMFATLSGLVRSSNFLEEVATEFDIQGLEIDWACRIFFKMIVKVY